MKNTGERYDWQALLIVTILMLFSIAIFYFTWGGMEFTFDNLYKYIYKNGMILIFGLFFLGVGIYCWYLWIINVWSKPKERILLLKDIYFDELYPILKFSDSDGSIIMYTYQPKSIFDNKTNANTIFDIDKYYKVLKTKNKIYDVIGLSDTSFVLKEEKESFWLTWYSPMGKWENIFLLPILYVIFLPGFLSFLMAEGFDKIYGIIFSAVPGFLIIFDIILKIKTKKK